MRDYIRSASIQVTGGMPSEFVETVRKETAIGDTIDVMTQEAYTSINSYTMVFKAKVLAKYEFVCVTTEGHFTWSEIALYRWQKKGEHDNRS